MSSSINICQSDGCFISALFARNELIHVFLTDPYAGLIEFQAIQEILSLRIARILFDLIFKGLLLILLDRLRILSN